MPSAVPHTVARLFVAICALAACGGSDAAPPATVPEQGTFVPSLTRNVIQSGLSSPWDVAFLPDSSMLFTEKCRGLSVRRRDGSVTRLFGTAGSAVEASDLNCDGQSGLLGVAVDPAFSSNRTVFVFMASTLTTPRQNRVIRLVLSVDLRAVSDRRDIVTDIPFKHVSTANGGAGAHSGGRLRFGPDGYLYIATGDNHNGSIPQSPTLLGGKVLRVTRDGTAAPGNGAPSGFDARIYAYGLRNVQGLAFAPGSGQLFAAEHGPNHTDEVTALSPGSNGGWDPRNRSSLTCPDNYCGYAGSATTMPMTDVARFPTAQRPSWTNNEVSAGVGPAEFVRGTQWGAWNGRLMVGVMRSQRLAVLTVGPSGLATAEENANLPATRYRGLTLGPDGNLYVVTDGGEIWQVTPGR